MSEEAPIKEDNSNLLNEDKENEKGEKPEKEEKEEKKKPNEEKKNDQGKDTLNDEEESKKSESDSESSKDLDSESNSEEKGKKDEDKGDEDNEENDDEEDIDDDDDIEDDEEEDKSGNSEDKKKKDPYRYYLTSKVDYSINIKSLKNGDYIYGIKENKFYKVIDKNTKDSNNADNFTIFLSLIDTSKAKTKKGKNEMKKITDNILHTALKYENKNGNKETNKDEEINLDKKEEETKGNKNQEYSSENLKKIENKIENGDKEKNKGKEKAKENIKDNAVQEEKEGVKGEKKEKADVTENSEEKIKKNEEINKEDKKEEIVEKGDKEENTGKEKKKEKEETADKKEKGEEKEKENKKDKKTNEEKNDKKSSKKSKSKKKSGLPITIKDYSNYTCLQKINIFYINYLNISHRLDMIIDINSSINDVIQTFQKLYHFYCDKYSDEKPPLIVFINNKRYSPLSKTKNKYFIPTKFDYKNDFLVILEKETYKFEEYDMGRNRHYSSNKVNLKGVKVPHFVYSSYYNLQVESFIITKNIPYLECEVYELKKEFYFNTDPENKRVSKKKIKDFLDLNWKEKSTLICVVKSGALRKSKDNYDGNCFEINRKFILSHGKIYIFVVTSCNKRVYTFNPRDFHNNGLIIVTRDDKGILNGFKAKRISDFIAY